MRDGCERPVLSLCINIATTDVHVTVCRLLTTLQTRWRGSSPTNAESTFTVVKVHFDRSRRETHQNIQKVVSEEKRADAYTRAISAEHRDNLPEPESVSLVSRLVGGGGEI